MGRMKELFMETRMHEFNGDNDPEIQQLAQQGIEEYIHMEGHPCPNCFEETLIRNSEDIRCGLCGQEFTQVDNALRFK